jgi:hypothetical protein
MLKDNMKPCTLEAIQALAAFATWWSVTESGDVDTFLAREELSPNGIDYFACSNCGEQFVPENRRAGQGYDPALAAAWKEVQQHLEAAQVKATV